MGHVYGNLEVRTIMPSRFTVSNNVHKKYDKLKKEFINQIIDKDFFGIWTFGQVSTIMFHIWRSRVISSLKIQYKKLLNLIIIL